ncbi:MAG TPA: ATP-binding protein [Aliidongia sp.]|uniref:sensor histidine kinase n=1 Tax=Aliidongia sp. TaxID=1914230 RepID=UPI002DDD0D5B|nr:ATP-binding protein [Aliidongia sp.]HEV2672957.1 ATP-binding protein [Aliidongia sp.]
MAVSLSANAPWRANLLTLHARFLPPSASCGEAYRVLADDLELPGLAIIEDGRIVGSIDRHSLLSTFARPVVRDVYERRPIALLMDRAPLIVGPETSISELSERIGRDKPSALMSGFIIADDGRFVGIGSVLDILRLQVAESRQRGLELEAARAEAVRADAAKSQFLAHMSHELRTPLNAVIGFADIIQSEMFGTGEAAWKRYKDYAGDIGASGRFLLEVINDILDLSKAAAGKAELREDRVSVATLLIGVDRFFRERARDAGLALDMRIPDQDIELWADETKLKQVALNLVSNAVKFTPAGGRINVSMALQADGQLRLTVADTGIGIAESDLARIFEPFIQLDSSLSRRHAGTGLGLPLARSFVELHGGTLDVASRPNAGTTVTVLLPSSRIQAIDAFRTAV